MVGAGPFPSPWGQQRLLEIRCHPSSVSPQPGLLAAALAGPRSCSLGARPRAPSERSPCHHLCTGGTVWLDQALGEVCKAKNHLLGHEMPWRNQPCSLYCSLCQLCCAFCRYVNYRNYKEKWLHPFRRRGFFLLFFIWSHSIRKPVQDSHSASFT